MALYPEWPSSQCLMDEIHPHLFLSLVHLKSFPRQNAVPMTSVSNRKYITDWVGRGKSIMTTPYINCDCTDSIDISPRFQI